MPSRHVIRSFEEDGYYHVFNRGVEKRVIFEDEKDYKIFLYYISIYLLPIDVVLSRHPYLPLRLYSRNLSGDVHILSFCLMPNHLHLLLRQNSKDGISKFMKQITNAYTEYFNKKNKRVGSLFQGRFKAINIDSDDTLAHISRYIHLNPVVANLVRDINDYPWSSYLDFINRNESSFCNKVDILSRFSSKQEYRDFVLDQVTYAKELDRIKHLLIE